MYIKNIKEYDIEANEAEIIVSDGYYEILCYAQPFEKKDGQFTLLGFMAKDIRKSLNNNYLIEKDLTNYFAYKLQGKLINVKNGLVAIGEIIIRIEERIPNDIRENDFIEFTVLRIDYLES